MKKLLIIPDVHGISEWKSCVTDAILSPDTQIIFLGDYVDSFNIDAWSIFENLKDIIEFKKKYSEQVTLLLGNHDYAYVFGKALMSGYNIHMSHEYRRVFNKNWNLFDLAWGYEGKDRYTLITHAGLTNSFYRKIINNINNPESIMHELLYSQPWEKMPLHKLLNHFIDQVNLMWTIGYARGGSDKSGSILWADRRELIADNYTGIDQIVGHTRIPSVEIKTFENSRLYFVDTHDEHNETLTGFKIEL